MSVSLLVVPHSRIVKNYFDKLGNPGSFTECSKVIKKMFEKLKIVEKHCKILLDEKHIKPDVQYEGGRLLQLSVDVPQKRAKTVLALIVAPLTLS